MKVDQVPWGFPCVRVEGGMYTGNAAPANTPPPSTARP